MLPSVSGRQPLVIRLSLTGPQLASQLTQAFARGLEHCRDVDDVFVTWDETSYRRLSVLTDAITNFCLERDIPVHVVKSATDQSFSSLARFRDTRKGILLSNMKFIQGCEFKSVRKIKASFPALPCFPFSALNVLNRSSPSLSLRTRRDEKSFTTKTTSASFPTSF